MNATSVTGQRMIHTSSAQKLQAHYNQKYLRTVPSTNSLSQLPPQHPAHHDEIPQKEDGEWSNTNTPQPRSPTTSSGKYLQRTHSSSHSLLQKYDQLYLDHTNYINTNNNHGGGGYPFEEQDIKEDVLISEAIHKLKKDRALTDIQLQSEREYNIQLEKKLQDVGTELTSVKSSLQENTVIYQDEINTLTALLEESLFRERKLRELNNEAYSLLTLYGIGQITEMNPYLGNIATRPVTTSSTNTTATTAAMTATKTNSGKEQYDKNIMAAILALNQTSTPSAAAPVVGDTKVQFHNTNTNNINSNTTSKLNPSSNNHYNKPISSPGMISTMKRPMSAAIPTTSVSATNLNTTAANTNTNTTNTNSLRPVSSVPNNMNNSHIKK